MAELRKENEALSKARGSQSKNEHNATLALTGRICSKQELGAGHCGWRMRVCKCPMFPMLVTYSLHVRGLLSQTIQHTWAGAFAYFLEVQLQGHAEKLSSQYVSLSGSVAETRSLGLSAWKAPYRDFTALGTSGVREFQPSASRRGNSETWIVTVACLCIPRLTVGTDFAEENLQVSAFLNVVDPSASEAAPAAKLLGTGVLPLQELKVPGCWERASPQADALSQIPMLGSSVVELLGFKHYWCQQVGQHCAWQPVIT
ncbi:nipblb [Symbiodinium sp. CCMP2592]|nr:nipblb [Symbiodinium sp. CCMP2592]